MLDKNTLKSYNNTRLKNSIGYVCHAPFVNLNFEQDGNVTACCYNRTFILGKYPENSIEEIWKGEKTKELRAYIKAGDLSGGCAGCKELINSGNYLGSKARSYDEFAPKTSLLKKVFNSNSDVLSPKVLEFEISNSCNLECTMCNGYFSSAIRKNREHLPALKNPYDQNFVSQIAGFLPFLSEAKFLGGEPFLIDLYYKIWDKIIEINPMIKVHITTNGTILNKKVIQYLEKLNAGIVISIDSLNKERYEQIRLNATFDHVLENINFFIDYTKRKNTDLTFAICPIQKNWMDIPAMLDFCNEKNIKIYFNTVWSPETESLKSIDFEKFQKIIQFYKSYQPKNSTSISKYNLKILSDFTEILISWGQETKVREKDMIIWKENFIKLDITKISFSSLLSENLFRALRQRYIHKEKVDSLFLILKSSTPLKFLDSYYECLLIMGREFINETTLKEFNLKITMLESKSSKINNVQSLCEQLITSEFHILFKFILKTDIDGLNKLMESKFTA